MEPLEDPYKEEYLQEFFEAVLEDDASKIQELVAKNAKLLAECHPEATDLRKGFHVAVLEGKWSTAWALHGLNKYQVESPMDTKNTRLIHALAEKGDVTLLTRFVEEFKPTVAALKEDLETAGYCNAYGTKKIKCSALHIACRCGHLEVAKYLFHRCPLDTRVLAYAANVGHLELVQWIFRHKGEAFSTEARSEALAAAAYRRHFEVVEFLLKQGADPNAYRESIAIYNCRYDQDAEMLKALLAAGGNANAKSYDTVLAACVNHTVLKEHVSVLLDHGADMNIQGSLYNNALHCCIVNGRVEALRVLLSNKKVLPDFQQPSKEEGLPAISLAATTGNKEIFRMLFDYPGCDMKAGIDTGNSPLQVACRRGWDSIGRMLCSHHADVKIVSNLDGNTPLHLWVSSGGADVSFTQELLNWGADARAKNFEGSTPLHCACKLATGLPNVEVLLASEANEDLAVENRGGYIPMHYAVETGSVDIVNALLAASSPVITAGKASQPLFMAVEHSFSDIVDTLLAAGADPNLLNDCEEEDSTPGGMEKQQNYTPLMLALVKNNVNIAQKVLQSTGEGRVELDLAVINNGGVTAIWFALLHDSAENAELVSSMIERGEIAAELTRQHPRYGTILQFAVKQRAVKSIQTLATPETINMECEVTVTSSGDWGQGPSPKHLPPPLRLAVDAADVDIISVLLEVEGLDPNKPDSNGNTPLHQACKTLSLDVIDLLLNHCNRTLKNTVGENPLHCLLRSFGSMAAEAQPDISRLEPIVRRLCKNDNVINDEDETHATPLALALHCGCLDLLRLLVCEFKANVNKVWSGFKGRPKDDPYLHAAIASASIDSVNIFLESHDVDLTVLDAAGNNVFHTAALLDDGGSLETLAGHEQATAVDVNKANNAGEQVAWLLTRRAATAALGTLFLKLSASPNATTPGEEPILVYAIRNKQTEVIELLLGRPEIDVNASAEGGDAPLHVAAAVADAASVKQLLEMGAEKNKQGAQSLTPVQVALKHKHYDIVRMLLAAECDVQSYAKGTDPPAVSCIFAHDDDLLQSFLDRGVDLDAATNEGDTALHVAVREGDAQLAYILLRRGARPLCMNKRGHTPLDIAAEKHYLKMAESFHTKPEMATAAVQSEDNQILETKDEGVGTENKENGAFTLKQRKRELVQNRRKWFLWQLTPCLQEHFLPLT